MERFSYSPVFALAAVMPLAGTIALFVVSWGCGHSRAPIFFRPIWIDYAWVVLHEFPDRFSSQPTYVRVRQSCNVSRRQNCRLDAMGLYIGPASSTEKYSSGVLSERRWKVSARSASKLNGKVAAIRDSKDRGLTFPQSSIYSSR